METNTQNLALISALKYADDEHIFVKPVCDLFGINLENQTRRIQSDPILKSCSIKKSDKLFFGSNHPHLAVNKEGFIRWIQIINPQIVTGEMREKLIYFQSVVFKILYGSAQASAAKMKYVSDHAVQIRELEHQRQELNKEIKTKRTRLNLMLKKLVEIPTHGPMPEQLELEFKELMDEEG